MNWKRGKGSQITRYSSVSKYGNKTLEDLLSEQTYLLHHSVGQSHQTSVLALPQQQVRACGLLTLLRFLGNNAEVSYIIRVR